MESRINVEFTPSPDTHSKELGQFVLYATDVNNQSMEATLNFDFFHLWEFSQDTTSTYFDVLVLAQLVYTADRLISRIAFADDGWCRDIVLHDVPVVNVDIFRQNQELFNTALSYLTGDNWNVSFVPFPQINYAPQIETHYNHGEYEYISLFSGGLDSLIGFIDYASIVREGKKILLVSHYDMGKERQDQKRILDACCQKHYFEEKYTCIQSKVGIRSCAKQRSTKYETTFRSRSFLFFAMGLYCAHTIQGVHNLIVPENGTISINIPLCKSRRSSCSTRTTHPVSMKLIMNALESVGIHEQLFNPYRFKSKADMMVDCAADVNKRNVLISLASLSCSCAKRSHNRWWDKDGTYIKENHVHHCGMCMPCIYRRVAMYAIGLDDPDELGTDIFHATRFFDIANVTKKTSLDINLLLRFIRKMNQQDVFNELLAEGIETENLDQYVNLVMRSYQQIKDWINDKGDDNIKHKVGL